MLGDQSLHAAPVQLVWALGGERLLHLALDQFHGNAARHLAGVVASHPVGEHGQADLGVGRDAVLVVGAHHAGMRGGCDLESALEIDHSAPCELVAGAAGRAAPALRLGRHSRSALAIISPSCQRWSGFLARALLTIAATHAGSFWLWVRMSA